MENSHLMQLGISLERRNARLIGLKSTPSTFPDMDLSFGMQS